MRDAGIIGFVPRGEYSPTETYDFLQFVYYGDSTYVAKKETTGNPPAENNEFWQLLAKGQVAGVSGVKGDKEAQYRTGDVNITASDIGALPVTGGELKSNSAEILKLNRDNGSVRLALGNDTKAGNVQVTPQTENVLFQFYQNIDNAVKIFMSLGGDNFDRHIYDGVTNTIKKILVEGEALPVTGGTLSSENGKILTLKRKNQTGGVEVLFSNEAKEVISLLVNILEEKGQFTLHDRTIASDIFIVSARKRKIYDYKTNELKEILVEGEALPSAGGTISSSELISLKLHRKLSGGYAAIDFQNDDGRQIRVMCGPDVDKGGLFELFSLDDETRIFRVSKRQRMIYDAQSNSLKRILVEGEALLLDGGATELKKPANRVLVLNNTGTGTLTEISFKLRGEEKSVITSREDAGFDFYDSTRKIVLARIANDALLYKGKKILVADDIINTGIKIEADKFPLLKLKRTTSTGESVLEFVPKNLDDIAGRIQVGYNEISDSVYFDFYEQIASGYKGLLHIEKTGSLLYDPASGTRKRILTEGDTAQMQADIAYIAMESGVDIYE